MVNYQKKLLSSEQLYTSRVIHVRKKPLTEILFVWIDNYEFYSSQAHWEKNMPHIIYLHCYGLKALQYNFDITNWTFHFESVANHARSNVISFSGNIITSAFFQ